MILVWREGLLELNFDIVVAALADGGGPKSKAREAGNPMAGGEAMWLGALDADVDLMAHGAPEPILDSNQDLHGKGKLFF